jgi:hypothetical protein
VKAGYVSSLLITASTWAATYRRRRSFGLLGGRTAYSAAVQVSSRSGERCDSEGGFEIRRRDWQRRPLEPQLARLEVAFLLRPGR